ncbi:hypothetical protein, partial [Parabacteroides merdae]|uniref:hypothetical protein n=1 Tax=Parabacteroides merdae TaxID=46503 RepID=UPI003B4355A6
MTSYQKKTEKQKERAEILFKEYSDIHMAYGLSGSGTKKADSKLNRLSSRRTFALTPKKTAAIYSPTFT